MPILNDMSWVLGLRTPFLTQFLELVTLLGYGAFLITFVGFGYFFFSGRLFHRVALLLVTSGITNFLLKDIFQDARPDPMYQIDSRVGTSYGFPSGHAQIAVTLWGLIAIETRNMFLRAGCILIIALIVFSRPYLGVHDLGDVLGGTLIGLGLLAFWVASDRGYTPLVILKTLGWPLVLVFIILAQALVAYMWPAHPLHTAPFWFMGMLPGWYLGVSLLGYCKLRHGLIVRLLVSIMASCISFFGMVFTMRFANSFDGGTVLDSLAMYGIGVGFGLLITGLLPFIFHKLKLADLS